MTQKKLGMVEAFKSYGAPLRNSRSAVSSIASDGALVISCSETYFRTANKVLTYKDTLSRSEGNSPGSELLRGHLEQGVRDKLEVRLVVAHWASGGSQVAEYFHVRPDVVGRVTEFDGDRFVIEFRKAKA